uniref:XRCC4 N-terminal domain-containing protein n=1 Tax=Timema poppense TaxID=170557 RepID=A0A7R9DKA1_TIMPO|nr:unnamed protein product [Timema poppensis]
MSLQNLADNQLECHALGLCKVCVHVYSVFKEISGQTHISYTLRLPKEGSNKFYRLQTEWDGESFSMLILDEVSAWTGKLSSLELNHLSRQLFLGNEEYINETRKALTSDGGDEQFTYSIENHQFSWKKVDVETDIRVKYGFVHLMNSMNLDMTSSFSSADAGVYLLVSDSHFDSFGKWVK